MRTIGTPRLRLVPVTLENADQLWNVLQQPDLREYQDLPEVDRPQFRRMVAARPRSLTPGSWGRFEWLIYIEGVEDAIGWASLRIAERSTSAGEVGYSILREYRGRGFASEALRGIVDEAFSSLEMRRVRAYCVPDNVPSRRVLRNAGFEEDGVLPHGATVHGKPVDVLGFVLERVRWQTREAV
jgi:ribosomal-protein-alanine N-acetyltransferase